MEVYSRTKLIRRMDTITQHWQRLTKLHWLLVEPTHIPTKLKHLILHQTLGLKSQPILIMKRKFCFVTNLQKTKSYPHFQVLFFSIHGYGTVTTSQGALFIGGSDGSDVATVACYNNAGWSRLDDLQSTRRFHRAIINGDNVYVVGGFYEQ